jgi:hypothetical protein
MITMLSTAWMQVPYDDSLTEHSGFFLLTAYLVPSHIALMNLTHIVWKIQNFVCFFRDLKMSFSSDEVNFLVYRYLQVRVKYVLFTFVTLYCVCNGIVSIIILLLREHLSHQPSFLSESTGTFLCF